LYLPVLAFGIPFGFEGDLKVVISCTNSRRSFEGLLGKSSVFRLGIVLYALMNGEIISYASHTWFGLVICLSVQKIPLCFVSRLLFDEEETLDTTF